jgi:cytochrome c5
MFAMIRYVVVTTLALALVACSDGHDEAPQTVTSEPGDTWIRSRLEAGRETYELACASCHETGKLDAPLTGNPRGWSDRSELWEAVLFEHAKAGYLEMPGKGGHPELTDEAVEAAAEYMLHVTFPDRLRD